MQVKVTTAAICSDSTKTERIEHKGLGQEYPKCTHVSIVQLHLIAYDEDNFCFAIISFTIELPDFRLCGAFAAWASSSLRKHLRRPGHIRASMSATCCDDVACKQACMPDPNCSALRYIQ